MNDRKADKAIAEVARQKKRLLEKKNKVHWRDVVITVKEKTCTKCKETKDSSEFGIDQKSKDNMSSRCKECRRKRNRESKIKQILGDVKNG